MGFDSDPRDSLFVLMSSETILGESVRQLDLTRPLVCRMSIHAPRLVHWWQRWDVHLSLAELVYLSQLL
jgi:aryl carrier-like protein